MVLKEEKTGFEEQLQHSNNVRVLCSECFTKNVQHKKQWLGDLGDKLAEAHVKWHTVSRSGQRQFQRAMEENLDMIAGSVLT